MLSLHELQTRFAQQIFNEPGGLPGDVIVANGLNSAERLDIYRNNVLVGLGKVLQSCYPVIERLVGEDFFRFTAQQFIYSTPSRSGDLNQYGFEFPEFLQSFEPAAQLPYLPDVARLEWAHQHAYYALEHAPLDAQALSQVPPECYGVLKFQLHPSASLITSPYPVHKIWQVNQSDYDGDQIVDLDQGGDKLLVVRCDLNVTIEPLAGGEYQLLQALHVGQDFATACEQALELQPDFDLTASLQQHVLQRTLVAFSF